MWVSIKYLDRIAWAATPIEIFFLREVTAMLGIAVAAIALAACYGICVEIGHSDVWRVL